MIHIRYYVDQYGVAPFESWIDQLDLTIQVFIFRTIAQVARGGSAKSIKALKQGLFEIKIPKGPGYRVYFCIPAKNEIMILCAGNKKTQNKDIMKARNIIKDYVKVS